MDQAIRYARNPEKVTEASRKKLHEIEGIVDYAADDLKTERCTYVTGIHLDSVETAAAEFMEVKQLEGMLGGRMKWMLTQHTRSVWHLQQCYGEIDFKWSLRPIAIQIIIIIILS